MTTPADTNHSTEFLDTPDPWAGGPDADDDADSDDALDRADVGAARDPVGLLLDTLWPWRRHGAAADDDERTGT